MGKEVSPGVDPPCLLCRRSQLLCPIKGWLVGQSLNFFPAPSLIAVIILARRSQHCPHVASMSQWRFGVMKLRPSASLS
jgi:hypothetical protein